MKKKMVIIEKRPTDLITAQEVEAMTGLGLSSIATQIAGGHFPASVDISAPGARKRMARWVRVEIERWIAAQIERRDVELAAQRQQERKDRALLGIKKTEIV
jgi:predicted DNA-binding transcriptional regulator AlpA